MTAGSRPVDLAPDAAPLPLDVPPAAGVRLDTFQLLNWGTFDGIVETLPLHGANGLLTGQVGAGKSTIVDALTTLFAPTQKVTFNRAAGADRSERTVATYVLGHYRHVYDEATGGTRAEALRSAKTAYTALLARFTGVPGAPGGVVSAGAAFWFPDGATAPHRMYFLARAALDITAHLTGHRDPRAVRTALRATGADLYENNFRGYQKALCRYLGVTPAALDLLVQTVSMKQVGNLTEFVRAHMLDAATAATTERISKILDHYADLTRAHELVKVARDQLVALVPIADAAAAYDRADARITATAAAIAAVPAHVGTHRVTLLDTEIARLCHELPTLHAQVATLRGRVTDEERQLRQVEHAIDAGGGAELGAARHGVDAATDTLGEVRRAHDEVRALAGRIGVSAPTSTTDYPGFMSAVAAVAEALAADEDRLRRADFEAQSALAEARRELETLTTELAATGTRDSNVPVQDATLRDHVVRELRLPADALPFAAELIAVCKDSIAWEAAAERLVRPFALSLLVPEAHYRDVAAWVDTHDLGRRLTYYRVPPASAGAATPRAGTMAAHLQVRLGTPVSDWPRAEVNRRYDHVCVATAAELAAHQRAVTLHGQVKDNSRHEKDDRPRWATAAITSSAGTPPPAAPRCSPTSRSPRRGSVS